MRILNVNESEKVTKRIENKDDRDWQRLECEREKKMIEDKITCWCIPGWTLHLEDEWLVMTYGCKIMEADWGRVCEGAGWGGGKDEEWECEKRGRREMVINGVK